jgi:predicted nucleic acid-binding protein
MEETDKPCFVLDSTTVINHLNKKLDIEAFLTALPEQEAEKIISPVTFMEVLAKSDMTEESEQEARRFLSACKIEDISPAIREETIAIRRANPKKKLPDCIIAATAIVLKATLLSNDIHLLNFVWPHYKVQAVV